jgi:hypothetical protein
MKLERKQPLRSLEDRTTDVMKSIDSLSWMPKYPEKPEHLKLIASCIASFCDTGEINYTDFDPDDPTQTKPGPMAWGWQKPLDWTVKRVAETCYSFPPPIRWRQIYCEGTPFWPVDGKTANNLLAVIEA